MWGIFWYKEINNQEAIRNWFLSALLTVTGIVWLSRERIAATTANSDNHHRSTLLSGIVLDY